MLYDSSMLSSDQMRLLFAAVERGLSKLPASKADEMTKAWTDLVQVLALPPDAELQCPFCGGRGVRAANPCSFCWEGLPFLEPPRRPGSTW